MELAVLLLLPLWVVHFGCDCSFLLLSKVSTYFSFQGLCGSPVLYWKFSVCSSWSLCPWFCWCSDSICSSHCCRYGSGVLGWLSVQALPSIMGDGAGDHWMLVCAFCYITHTTYVDRSHSMKMVRQHGSGNSPYPTHVHKWDRLHNERTHEGASGRLLTLIWNVQLWLNTWSTMSTKYSLRIGWLWQIYTCQQSPVIPLTSSLHRSFNIESHCKKCVAWKNITYGAHRTSHWYSTTDLSFRASKALPAP